MERGSSRYHGRYQVVTYQVVTSDLVPGRWLVRDDGVDAVPRWLSPVTGDWVAPPTPIQLANNPDSWCFPDRESAELALAAAVLVNSVEDKPI